MERFCVSHDCHRLGCDVEMVQSNVGEWVGYDDASAEIAKLRAEVDEKTTRLRDADMLADEVAALVMRRVIDSRSAASDALLRYREEPRTELSDRIAALESALSAARAALDGEREALAVICDEQASLAKRDRCHAEAVTLHQIAVMIRARRAAEAKPKE